MADLDPISAAALCRALERVLPLELGHPVTCTDVSSRSERWDIEARDREGTVVRRISHTATVVSRMAMAVAELRDIHHALEEELAAFGIDGIGINIYGRSLPTSRGKRQQLARTLAVRIRDHLRKGVPIIEDPVAVLRRGQHPWEIDEIARAFAHVSVHPLPKVGRAKVTTSGDDRWSYRIPTPYEEVLPAITFKKERHGELTPTLTLVIELTLTKFGPDAAEDTRARLDEKHRGFASVYAGTFRHETGQQVFLPERVY